jgi:2-polyprenyl-3-methyl-5-hydroxy-6-metoxy-1,4-benzoquinol methylase
MEKIKSPLTLSENVVLETQISTDKITEMYYKSFKIDVSKFFKDIPQVSIYRCLETQYRFYIPFNVAGDGDFYEKLQYYDWYYMPWKWEHQQTTKLLKQGMHILEVGCAKGDFLAKINEEYQVEVTGLELNQAAVAAARTKGLNVLNEMIQEHSETHQEKYDLVCSFQVLEHISDVHSFIDAQIKCLKKGGSLIIAVPNNDSFLGLDASNMLNLPPHHMGLWNKTSFTNIEKIFNIKIKDIFFEPLQPYHRDYFTQVINGYLTKIYHKRRGKYGFFGRLFHKIRKNIDKKQLYKHYPTLENFTILVVFEKI